MSPDVGRLVHSPCNLSEQARVIDILVCLIDVRIIEQVKELHSKPQLSPLPTWNGRVLHDREIGVEVPGSVELVSPLRAVGGWRLGIGEESRQSAMNFSHFSSIEWSSFGPWLFGWRVFTYKAVNCKATFEVSTLDDTFGGMSYRGAVSYRDTFG